MLLKQLFNSVAKVGTQRVPLAAIPKRNFMVQPRLMSNAFLIKPTVMNFSTAAETPASHMHRTTTLDNRI